MSIADPAEKGPAGVFEALHQIGVAIGGVLEPVGLARLVAGHSRALLSAVSVGLWLFDEQDNVLKVLHLENASMPSVSPDTPPGEGLIGRAFTQCEAIIVVDYPNWEHATPRARHYHHPPALVAVPLIVGGQAIGVIGVGFPEPHLANPAAVETLTLLAAVVAPALEAARLYEAARTARRCLEESEQRFRSLFDFHPDAVFAWDRAGRATLANLACQRLSGYTVEEILGEPREYAVPAEFERATALFEAALRGEPQQFETVIAHKDGHRVDIWTIHIPIVIEGQVTGVLGSPETSPRRAEPPRHSSPASSGSARSGSTPRMRWSCPTQTDSSSSSIRPFVCSTASALTS